MKIFAILAAVLLLVGFVLADYKWRQWMAARRREHNGSSRETR